MGRIVQTLIEHKLTSEEILNLPEHLRNILNDTLTGQWHWTTANMNKQILVDLWTRKGEYFINNPHSESDLALLKKDNLTLHFSSPHLVTFDNSLRWDIYKRTDQLREEFNRLAKAISKALSAIDMLIVPDLSSIEFFNEDEDLTVNAYRQRANGNEMFAIELD